MDVANTSAGVKNLIAPVPTALSVNAVYGSAPEFELMEKSFTGWAVPETVYIDYDVLLTAQPFKLVGL